jgi:hypothetical protein
MKVCMVMKSQNNSVSIVTGVQFPPGKKMGFFSLHHHYVWTGSGAHPAPNLMGIRGCFPRGELAKV